MKVKRLSGFLSFILCLVILSCSSDNDDDIIKEEEEEEVVIDEDFVTNSRDTVFTDAITFLYSDTGVEVINPYSDLGVVVSVDKGNVVVTSTDQTAELNYVLSGNTKNGSFKIYSDYKFGLVFNGVDIISDNGSAINIQSGKKVTVTLVSGTSNRLIDSNVYTPYGDEDMKATFFSEGQLVFEGNGRLLVYGMYKHAICSDDYIRINKGDITVATAVSDGIHAKDYFRMDGGSLSVKASSDGIDCDKGYILLNDGNITIKSADDGIVASYEDTDTSVNSDITIQKGTINIVTTGQKGAGIKSDIGSIHIVNGDIAVETKGIASKAIKAGNDILISDGNVNLVTSGSAYYDSEERDISSSAGIKGDGNLTVEKGIINITSTGAGGKGINVDGELVINDGTINVVTTGGQYKSGSDDTAAKAIKSDGNLTINGGNINIKTSGVEAEGLESKKTLTINAGTIEIEAYDDCINASNHIQINGGNIYCYSETNDGIDSNGTLTVTGGVVISSGTKSPEEGFDCDNNTFKITGGVLVGTGGSTSKPTANVCTQYSLIYGTTGTANQLIHIVSVDGQGILTYVLPRTYSQMTLLFSSPDLEPSTEYTIYTGGSVSGGSNFHGLYTDGNYQKGTSVTSFKTSSMVTSIGSSSGGPGGRP